MHETTYQTADVEQCTCPKGRLTAAALYGHVRLSYKPDYFNE